MTRTFLITSLLFATSAGHSADPPSKRGGLFGFGAPKTEQISAGLFPAGNQSLRQPTGPRIESDTIFRRGNPEPLAPVAYVIENGRKVETPVEPPVATPTTEPSMVLTSSDDRKKGGFFAFGRKNESENEIVTPVPASSEATPIISTPIPTASVAPPVMTGAPQSDVPRFEGGTVAKEEKSGWHPFARKKSERSDQMEIPAASPVETVATAVPVATPTKPNPAPTVASAASTSTTTYEVPRNTEKKEDSKKDTKPSGGILSPIANIRIPRKDVDLSSAETIIQNGEIVNETATTYDLSPNKRDSGPRQAPQIVDGVKTYSSWGDVNARSTSAADKILNSIR